MKFGLRRTISQQKTLFHKISNKTYLHQFDGSVTAQSFDANGNGGQPVGFGNDRKTSNHKMLAHVMKRSLLQHIYFWPDLSVSHTFHINFQEMQVGFS